MNHLQYETSPYLLQHAHNPVDWFAWKEEALEKAKREDKPILVSIGYSTCHWCHVMERESFEDAEIAAFMNEHFVNIKIDREERPDLDQIYMEACQAITGGGGWPLNCFLTPDGRPFLAGTYYPPMPRGNRPSWMQLLMHVSRVFKEQREKVYDQADRLTKLVRNSSSTFFSDEMILEGPNGRLFHPALMATLFEKVDGYADKLSGGFGGAPKFPSTMALDFLLRYHQLTKEELALEHLHFSLEKMIRGGIYDQLGGGFARYATDQNWLIPHFEKMLYDNALIVGLLADTLRFDKRDLYQEAIVETLAFVQREMTHSSGGFYSALDADSEGVEGKFYVWSFAEVQAALGAQANLFCTFYDITPEGNWEHTNILWRPMEIKSFAAKHGISVEKLQEQLAENRAKLLSIRAKRIRPGLDHKILLSWNALMCTAYVKAYHATLDPAYEKAAWDNIYFIEQYFRKGADRSDYYHVGVFKGEEWKPQYDAYLEDYSHLIAAMLQVYTLDFDTQWIRKAADLCDYVIEQFSDENEDLFYFTSSQQQDIPIRRVDVTDNALPSGNSMMLHNLMDLGLLLDQQSYQDRAQRMTTKMLKGIERYPSSFANWATASLGLAYPRKEIAVVGKNAKARASQLQHAGIYHCVIMASEQEQSEYPLLADKPVDKLAQIYICQNFTCERPVDTLEQALLSWTAL